MILKIIIDNESKINPLNFESELYSEFEEYIYVRQKINNVFDTKTGILDEYDNNVLKINNNQRFKNAYKKAKIDIVPPELQKLPDTEVNNELFSVLKGISINEEQAKVIQELSGRKIFATTEKYKNYAFIKKLKNR